METQRQLFDRPVNVFLGEIVPRPGTAFVMRSLIRPLRIVPPQRPLRSARISVGGFVPMAGLKPIEDGTRRMSPFGLPKGAGWHQQARRSTGGIARNQVDPPRGGTDARVQRHRCLRNRWPHRPPFDCQPRLGEGRLTGFPGSLAEVLRHRVGGGIRVAEAAPTGFSDARFVVQPAYSLGPHSVSPLRKLAGGCAPSDPCIDNGAP